MMNSTAKTRPPIIGTTMTAAGDTSRDVLFPAVGLRQASAVGTGSADDVFNIPIDPRTGQRLAAERKSMLASDTDALDIPVTHASKCPDATKFFSAVQPILNLAVLLLVALLVVNSSTSASRVSAMETRLEALQQTCAQIQLALSSQSTSISNSVATHAADISSSVAAHAANISHAVAVHAAASAESSQSALRSENYTLNNILGHVVNSGSSLQMSILQTQASLWQVNQSITSFVSSLSSSPALSAKRFTSACRSGFLPDVDWIVQSLGQGCTWHSGKTIFNLGVNGTGPYGLVNKPNLTVTFSCTYASAWGGGPPAPAISVSTPDLNWFSTSSNTACDGSQKSFFQSYPGMITLPALATATIVWTWCGNSDATVTINSMCARVDWT
jgi:hypothetical protein